MTALPAARCAPVRAFVRAFVRALVRSLARPLALPLALTLAAAGCAHPAGLTDVMQRPAERALFNGLRAYDDGQYAEAEHELQLALKTGLVSAKDRANAHKHLAFVYCTSQRAPACEAAFRHARGADAQFALSRAESGHPLWGPVYNKVVAR